MTETTSPENNKDAMGLFGSLSPVLKISTVSTNALIAWS